MYYVSVTRKVSVADKAKMNRVLISANTMISAGCGRRYWAHAYFGEPPFQVWPGSLWTVVTQRKKKLSYYRFSKLGLC